MVTAVDIDACNTRPGLAKLRSTCRRQRTIRLKDLSTVQDQLSCADIFTVDEEQRKQLAVREAAIEEEVATYTELADRCTAKINKLLSETQAPAEVQPGNPSEQMDILVNTLTDAFQRVAPTTSSPSTTTCKSGKVPSLGDVVKFNVSSRALKDVYLLPLQYRRLESLFLSAGFGELVPSTNGDVFQPFDGLRVPLMEKLLETLAPHTALLAEATRLVDSPSIGYDWLKVKCALIDKDCSPVETRKEVLRRASQLVFPGPGSVSRFVDEVRELRSLHLISLRTPSLQTAVSLDADGDHSAEPIDVTAHFVDLVLRPLPNNILTELIKEVTAVARQSFPERRNWEWQLKLPLDELCYAHTFTTEAKKSKPSAPNNYNSNNSDVRDKLWQVGDHRGSTDNNSQQRAAHAEA
ncbi:hypothetical protein FOZ63_009943, partial [Perkinsus olseni]